VIGTKISRCGGIDNLENRWGIKLTFSFSALRLTFLSSYPILLLCFLVCLIFSPCINSQQAELQFENILVEGGMPVNVKNIYQDKTGYLWFATWSGLYKYDGYNFISYKHDIEDSTSILDNTLSVVYEDMDGLFWIGSRLGLERFDPKTETFLHFTPNPSDTGDNKSNQIWAINEDKNGMILIGTGNGMYNFDKASKKFTSIKFAGANLSDTTQYTIHAFYADEKGSLWGRK
jgi:ligand-binding sensor domain-containing protein